MRVSAVVALVLCLAAFASAQQLTVLDLAFDASTSISNAEFDLMKDGTAFVLCNTSIIPTDGSLALGAFFWSTNVFTGASSLPIRIINSQSDLDAFGAAFKAIARPGSGSTDVRDAVNAGTQRVNAFAGTTTRPLRKVLDIVKDGLNNQGSDEDLDSAVTAASTSGLTINCLAIQTSDSCDDVIARQAAVQPGEPGYLVASIAFTEFAEDFASFTDAFQRKVQREVDTSLDGCVGPCATGADRIGDADCSVQEMHAKATGAHGFVKLCFSGEACPAV